MSQDEINPQFVSVGGEESDKKIKESVGKEESLAGPSAVEVGKEESLAGPSAVEVGKEESLAGPSAVEVGKEESLAGPSAVECGKEESLAGDAISKPEDMGLASDPSVSIVTVGDQLKIITSTLINTVNALKRVGNKYPEIFEDLSSFRENIKLILKEIETAFEGKEKMVLQTKESLESRTQTNPVANVEDSAINAGVLESTDVTASVASESSGTQEVSEREICMSRIALEYVEKVVQAAKIRQKMEEVAEVKEAAEPSMVEKTEDAEKKADNIKLKYPSLTGKYTFIVEANELSSSDVSVTSEPAHSTQDAAVAPQQLLSRDMNVVPEQIASSSKGSNEFRSSGAAEQIVNPSKGSDKSLDSPDVSRQQ